MTQVSQAMTTGVRSMAPNESMMKAAQAMSELDVGVIPVCDGDRLVGMVTDRDLVLRGVAQGCPADQTPLSTVMSRDALWCYEDQSVEEAAEKMREAQVRRMPVVDRDQHLVGMLSLGDIATKADAGESGEALQGISQPSRPDRSSQSAASGAAGGGSAYSQRKEQS
jgi:CBS domain-containing protein